MLFEYKPVLKEVETQKYKTSQNGKRFIAKEEPSEVKYFNFKIFVFFVLALLLSYYSFAGCETEIKILETLEGYRAECYFDGHQYSAGYGSRTLCNKIGNGTVTQAQAKEHLRTVDFPKFLLETKELKFIATEKERCILATVVYNKGKRGVHNTGLMEAFNYWKRTKTRQAKYEVQLILLKMSCQKKQRKWIFNKGLYARQGVVLKMLEGKVSTPQEAENIKLDFLNNEELKFRVKNLCNDKNKTLTELIETI